MVVRPRMTPARLRQDALLGEGVDAGEGVVQNQNAGIAQDGAGDGGALLLAAGESDAALADHGLVAVGERFDIGREPGDFGGAADLVLAWRLRHAEGDVLAPWWR